FNLAGQALDMHGTACTQVACPHCHLVLPRAVLEIEPLFFSIGGAPTAGKSCFLASMVWELRKRLPRDFFLTFGDAEAGFNELLSKTEDALFLDPKSTRPVEIIKTEP